MFFSSELLKDKLFSLDKITHVYMMKLERNRVHEKDICKHKKDCILFNMLLA